MALLDFVGIDFYFKFLFTLLTLAPDKNALAYGCAVA